jgi:hypothetical protein
MHHNINMRGGISIDKNKKKIWVQPKKQKEI